MGWLDAEALEDSALAAGVAHGSRGAKLPLGMLWVAAVLSATNVAGVFDGPDEEFGRVHRG